MADANVLSGALPTIPGGSIVGKLSGGDGNAGSISLADLAAALNAYKGRPYRIGFSWEGGIPGNSQKIGHHCVSIGCTFPPNFTPYMNHASQAGGDANATGSTVFTVASATSGTGSYTAIGTVTFGAGGITPTFATTGGVAVRVAAGSLVRIIGPGTADATFANPFFTLVGYES